MPKVSGVKYGNDSTCNHVWQPIKESVPAGKEPREALPDGYVGLAEWRMPVTRLYHADFAIGFFYPRCAIRE